MQDVLCLALTNGETFLPDAAAYDDLFYKLVESGEALVKLRDTYSIATAAEKVNMQPPRMFLRATQLLCGLSAESPFIRVFHKSEISANHLLSQQDSRINALIGVSQHYQELIESQRAKKEHLSPKEVSKIIKQGYETLSIESKDGTENGEGGYREVEYRSVLKRIARVAVADAGNLILR